MEINSIFFIPFVPKLTRIIAPPVEDGRIVQHVTSFQTDHLQVDQIRQTRARQN